MSPSTANRLERVRYFPRQLMTAEDMRTEQDYFVERLRRHNRLLHGWGIVCGLQVLPDATADQPWRVKVCPGSAVAATGDEIDVARPVWFDLARPPDASDAECLPCPCPPGPPITSSAEGPKTHYLAVRYLCRPARPVRTGHADCGCGDGCETSRWRDDYELGLLSTLDGPYANEWTEDELEWVKKLKEALTKGRGLIGLPTRRVCPQGDYPWVILATVTANLSAPPPAVAANPGPQNNLTPFLGAAAEPTAARCCPWRTSSRYWASRTQWPVRRLPSLKRRPARARHLCSRTFRGGRPPHLQRDPNSSGLPTVRPGLSNAQLAALRDIAEPLQAGMSLADRAATANMSDRELALLEAELQRWLDEHPGSSLERREIEATRELIRANVLQRQLAPLISTFGVTNAAGASLLQGFLAGLDRTVDAGEVLESIKQQLSTPLGTIKFMLGVEGGVILGALKSLKDNIVGLLLLALAAGGLASVAVLGPVIFPTVMALNPELRAKLEAIAASVLTQLRDLVIQVLVDPAFLTDRAFAIGVATGLEAGNSINAEFVAGSPWDKGLFVGEMLGYAAMEIALLFLGPEEILLKGGRGAGRGAAFVAEKVSQRTRALLLAAPELVEALSSRLGKLARELEPLFEGLRPVLAGEGGPSVKLGELGELGGESKRLPPKNKIQEGFWDAMKAKTGEPGGGATKAAKGESEAATKTARRGLPRARGAQARERLAKSAKGYRIALGEQPSAEIVAALQEEGRHLLAVSVLSEDGEVVSFWIVSASGKEAAAAGHTEIAALRILQDAQLVGEGDLVLMQGRLRPCTGNCPDMGFCYKALDAISKQSRFDIVYDTTALMNEGVADAYITTIETTRGAKQVLAGPLWRESSSAKYFEAGRGLARPDDTYGAGKPLSAAARALLKKIGLLR